MARKPRVHYPGALYHVILRGNGGQTIFFDDKDRTRFYFLVQEGIERFGHRIHAFCLMTNHVHLAIQVGRSRFLESCRILAFRYTRWVNWRQSRSGHLFQGRYKAVLVDADAYLQELTRYIHLNPVRAGMVKEPEDYLWSGHRAYLGLETIPWLTTEWVLGQFSERQVGSPEGLRKIRIGGEGRKPARGVPQRIRSDSRILGDDTFMDQVLGEKEVMPRTEGGAWIGVIKEVCRRYSVKEKEVRGYRVKTADYRRYEGWQPG